MSEELKHFGTQRHSGRYPWGSGDNPYQRAKNWHDHYEELKRQGYSQSQIAEMENLRSVTQLRARISLSADEIRSEQRSRIIQLKDHGYSNSEIGRRMGINESTVRSLLNPIIAERANMTKATAAALAEEVNKKGFIDVGAGVENHMGVSRTKLNTAVSLLEQEGYKIHNLNIPQVGIPGQFTIMKVLGPPDSEWKDIRNDFSKIKSLNIISEDFGRTFTDEIKPISNIDSKRLMVRYKEDGGANKDGTIELRRGVPDLDMKGSQYAQVRIGVDGTHFLKGMAIYNDDMPDGVDIIFNSNKSDTGNKLDALKGQNPDMQDPKAIAIVNEVTSLGLRKDAEKIEIAKRLGKAVKNGEVKPDSENPFSASIKVNGQRGALNIVNEEGDWEKWSKTLSSQMLSKQTPKLAQRQLDLSYIEKKEEYDEIMALTNPVVQKKLLLAFSDDCDSSAVHLKAAGLPRQASKVILPIPDLKSNEVYAPTFNNGEHLVLIRHPHGGIFEIPNVVVNNKSKAAQAIMKNAPDAIGIHPKVAEQLSGADFDGDTVIAIPNNMGRIKTAAPLKGLEGFDPIERYKIPPGSKIPPINPVTKQKKMGEVSNLITDMTIKGADYDELARAVRHSMVVIDSEKHNLDYRQSFKDNRIAELAAKYQSGPRGGASTIVSKAKSEYRVDERKPRSAKDGGPIDPLTGKKVYTNTGATYIDKKTGKTVVKTTRSTKIAEAEDAFTLSSGRPIEDIYAGYANSMKALGNDSRRNALAIISPKYSPSAKKTYASEVESLQKKLDIALRNKPLERQAQVIANSKIARSRAANPNLDDDDLKKIRNRELANARVLTGANKILVDISSKEWEAIQAGAISASKLTQILDNGKLDQIKALATPRSSTALSPARLAKAKSMLNAGLTQAEVAESLGVSTSTLSKALK